MESPARVSTSSSTAPLETSTSPAIIRGGRSFNLVHGSWASSTSFAAGLAEAGRHSSHTYHQFAIDEMLG